MGHQQPLSALAWPWLLLLKNCLAYNVETLKKNLDDSTVSKTLLHMGQGFFWQTS